MQNKVMITSCPDYSAEAVRRAVAEIFDAFGGAEQLISAGDKVLLKPNLVAKKPLAAAVTTHPSVVEEVARRVLAAGAKEVVICDSPGGLYNEGFVGAIYRASGMDEAARKSGARLNADWSSTLVQNDAAGIRRGYKLDITNAVLAADKIINIAKLKTHGYTGYTGAAKNLFGAIAGLGKVQMHADYKTLTDFCEFLIDLEQFLKPKIVLHIIDAVMGMERDGPTAGDPKFIGRLIAGKNPYLADYAAVRIMNVKNPLLMPLLSLAGERGAADYDTIEQAGDPVEECIVKDFKAVLPEDFRGNIKIGGPKGIRNFLFKRITRRPRVTRRCRACGKCAEHCPPKAIALIGRGRKRAKIDLKRCIKCFCCQELCPFQAVKIKKPLLYRFATRSSRRKNKTKPPAPENKK